METLNLIIERQEDKLWGRVIIDDNLITDFADSTEELVGKIKVLAVEFQGPKYQDAEFEIQYDLEAFFEEFKALKITEIANIAGLNSGLVRQYASGVKTASEAQAKKIENAIHELGQRLQAVKLNG